MFRKKIIFILAILGIISALLLVKEGSKSSPESANIIEPLKKPAVDVISAAGIIESYEENFNIGAPESGIIEEIYVNVGDSVEKGDPLFKIDSNSLEADLKINQSKESIAQAELLLIQGQLEHLEAVRNHQAISKLDLSFKKNEETLAKARLQLAQMEKEKTLYQIQRLLICSPISGTVLQRNIRKGEFLHNTDTATPPMIIGNTNLLQVRADIDEQNVIYLVPGASGVACPKNSPDLRISLKYLRIEPYVIPKKSLTGSSKEKVDTRVLQVIYTFEPTKDLSLYVGQQVELYIEKLQQEDEKTK